MKDLRLERRPIALVAIGRVAMVCGGVWAAASIALAAPPEALPKAGADARAPSTITVKNAEVPFSSWASPAARDALAKQLSAAPGAGQGTDVASVRKFNEKLDEDRLAIARKLYDVDITQDTLGGVHVQRVTPSHGVLPQNRNRILINLHNGGFMWGEGPGGLVESVPIAATGRIEVVTVDYRMAPEHRFPAASEDVAAVYRALLQTHRPEDIGIYGCSAGGILAAESVAWFAAHGLPRPGAIASSCGTGAELSGDSAYLASVLIGGPAIPPGGGPLLLAGLPYFMGVSPDDPLAYPIQSKEVLAKFPPTLLITGSRDFAESSMTVMHRRLREAGVPAELFVFDGLWHAFLLAPDLPESQEAYGLISRFFDEHLGRGEANGKP